MATEKPKEPLELRKARVEIYSKIDEARFNKVRYEEEEKKMKLENSYKEVQLEKVKKNGEGWNTPIEQLLNIARAWCIDNDKTIVGSEPAIRSLWEEDELAEIKARILKKMKEL